jgi:hypothetical protein
VDDAEPAQHAHALDHPAREPVGPHGVDHPAREPVGPHGVDAARPGELDPLGQRRPSVRPLGAAPATTLIS